MQEVASLGAPLFALFEHPAPRMVEGTALLMRAVAEGGVLAAAPMREAALVEGALLSHLLLALTQQVVTSLHGTTALILLTCMLRMQQPNTVPKLGPLPTLLGCLECDL